MFLKSVAALILFPLAVAAEVADSIPYTAPSSLNDVSDNVRNELSESTRKDISDNVRKEVSDNVRYPAGSARLRPATGLADKYLEKELPAEWIYDEGMKQILPAEDSWWKQFDDPVLTELIEIAEKNNYNLKSAFTRIESAKASLQQVRSAWYPTIGLTAGYTKSRSSGETGPEYSRAYTDDYIGLGLDVSWEIDVFGRVYARSKAGKAGVAASEADYVAAQIALSANVAKAYISLRLAQTQLAIAEEHIRNQEKIVNMTRARMECGLGNKLEVTQSRETYLATKAGVPTLKSEAAAAKNSLAVLCGLYPEEVEKYCTTETPLPILLNQPETGVPADLLRRRPDILAAEQQLAVAAANVGVSKKEFLPTLSLTARGFTQSHKPGNLFKSNSLGYMIAPQLSWTIFEGFARKAAVAEAKAALEQAVDDYNQTVLNAVQEVNTAIARLEGSREAIGIQLELLEAGKESLKLAVDLYKRGLTQFSNVTDAQINVLEQENTLASYKAGTLQAAITLYEAIGGGY